MRRVIAEPGSASGAMTVKWFCARHRLVAGVDAGAAPALGDGPALAQIFRALVAPDHGVEAKARRRLPGERALQLGLGVVHAERRVDARLDERLQREDAGDGVAGGDEIPRQLLVDRRPIRRGHAGGQVPACRVAGDDEPPLEARELAAGGAQLFDDVADPHLRAEVVAGDRDVEPVRVRPARQMAEERGRQILPVAAMDEDDGRGGAGRARRRGRGR